MKPYIYDLKGNATAELSEVGGKAANLMALNNVADLNIPEGFCITTTAYEEVFKDNRDLDQLLSELSLLKINEQDRISGFGQKIREIIIRAEIPENMINDIKHHYKKFGQDKSYAVRSSATIEDLPNASFAGQYDTYLNISGFDTIVEHISKCWASLYTDRSIIYRIKNGFDHKEVNIAVIVQVLVSSDASGVMFTADPMTSDRTVVSIGACIGLGEALVSGLVDVDNYKICDGKIMDKSFAGKDRGIKVKEKSFLSDKQIFELEIIGRSIEAYFSCPQDIEWCIEDDQIYIVQSRPMTTLYPLAAVNEDEKRIYLSSGHLQMMTKPIKPLGMHFFKSVMNDPPLKEIGGRLYADISGDLSTFLGRIMTKYLLDQLGDTLLTNAVLKVINDKQLIKSLPKGQDKVFDVEKTSGPLAIMFNAYKAYKKNNPDIVKEIINKEEEDIKRMGQELQKLSGDDLFEYIYNDHDNRRVKIASPMNAGVLTAGLLTARTFDKKIEKWIGETNAADTIIMSLPNSVTTDTGLSLMGVTDVIREYDEVVDYLKNPSEESFFEDLIKLDGGIIVNDALKQFLSEYGMRCSGDIDITVPRWIENPIELVPSILSNLENFKEGASKDKFEQGKIASDHKIQALVEKVEKLPGGKGKGKKIRKMASVIRNYIGFREYPKFSYMKRYYFYKQAMLKEAENLVGKGFIDEVEDIFYLYFDELRDAVKGKEFDKSIISKRRKDYEAYEKLRPPRIMTSDGQVIIGEYQTNSLPKDTLQGQPVSAGVIEGRARIVKDLKDAYLSEGDILVTEFTDPSWTPTFVSIKGLITEVGGLSTHGAIIAREYGLPAVVSVRDATKLIKEGQLIRLNGSEGSIEFLSEGNNVEDPVSLSN